MRKCIRGVHAVAETRNGGYTRNASFLRSFLLIKVPFREVVKCLGENIWRECIRSTLSDNYFEILRV